MTVSPWVWLLWQAVQQGLSDLEPASLASPPDPPPQGGAPEGRGHPRGERHGEVRHALRPSNTQSLTSSPRISGITLSAARAEEQHALPYPHPSLPMTPKLAQRASSHREKKSLQFTGFLCWCRATCSPGLAGQHAHVYVPHEGAQRGSRLHFFLRWRLPVVPACLASMLM